MVPDPFKFLQFSHGDIYDRLPESYRLNLSQGTPVEFDPRKLHFCLRREEIFLVLNYILESDDLLPIYTNPAFRENIKCYLENFVLPYLNCEFQCEQFEFVTTQSTKHPSQVPECVLMHGRFNGVPHPGYIRSLRYIKRNYNLPLTLAIETDDYSINYGQLSFLDPVFRASMLWYTGTIDRLVINKAPFHETEHLEMIEDYWDKMYGVDTFILNPMILIAHGDEDYWRKEDRSPMRLNIHTLDMLSVEGMREFHMNDLRNANLTPAEVQACWKIAMSA